MVTAFDASTGEHVVTYDDGDVESVVLEKETFEWLEPNGAFVSDPNASLARRSTPPTSDVHDPSKPPGWWPVTCVVAHLVERRGSSNGGSAWAAAGSRTGNLRRGLCHRARRRSDFQARVPGVGRRRFVAPMRRAHDAGERVVRSLPIDTAATQSLALAAEDLDAESATAFEKDARNPSIRARGRKALWALAADARAAPEMFVVHRKGFGVVCADPNGVRKAGTWWLISWARCTLRGRGRRSRTPSRRRRRCAA